MEYSQSQYSRKELHSIHSEFGLEDDGSFFCLPSRATSDTGEGPLNVDATFEGMHAKIALEKRKTGQVVNKKEAQEYCDYDGIRIISTRWVVVHKHNAINTTSFSALRSRSRRRSEAVVTRSGSDIP